MNRTWFVSFPRSGSNWYIQMVADSLGEPHHYVHDTLMRKSHRRTHGTGMSKIFFMYRHPKDAFLSYIKFMLKQRKKGEILDEAMLKRHLFTTENFKGRNLILWWKTLMNYYSQPEFDVLMLRIKYEDVLFNPIKEVKRGLVFLRYSCEPIIEKQLKFSEVELRMEFYTGRWKTEEAWTKKIDDMVNNQLSGYFKRYGYED